DGYIYGIRPDGQLVCLDLEGKLIWTSTSANKFGSGPYSIVDGLIYVMNDTGELGLAQTGPSGYVELARAKVLDGHESWGPMAVASGRLIVRDTERMICLDISEH
ncbi:MAG: PQQ-binding-like beta-propeller repeat protein, partial [Planctomycetota bacterium]